MSSAPKAGTRVLLTYDYPFTRHVFGGGHQIVAGFAHELQRLGASVTLLAPAPDELGLFTRFEGRVCWVRARSARFTVRQWTVGLVGFLKILSGRYDTAASFGGESLLVGLACWIRGIPHSTYVCAPDLHDFRSFEMIRWNLEEFYLFLASKLFASQVLVLSSYLETRVENVWRISPDRVHKVGCGFHPAYLRERPYVPRVNEGFLLVSVGRITFAQKPLDRALKALESVADKVERWTIIGSGTDQLQFEEQIRMSPLASKVHFLGALPPDSSAENLTMCDIAFLPSYRESLMLTVYEAAVAGKVVVTNDVADIATHFRGLKSVCVARDATVDGLSEALSRVMDAWPNLQAEASVARDLALQHFDWKTGAVAILGQRACV